MLASVLPSSFETPWLTLDCRLTKTLHFVKLRTACGGSGEKLLLQQTSNPLRRKLVLEHPLPADFTDKFIESFSKPIDSDTCVAWLILLVSADFA